MLGKYIRILLRRKRESIYSSLLIYFILFALIPTLILNFVYYSLASKSINDAITKLGNEMIVKVCGELNYFFESVIRVGDVAADNQHIQTALRMDYGSDVALRYSKDLEMDAELYFASFLQPKIEGLSVLGANGGEYKSYDRTFLNQVHKDQDWYKTIEESKGYVWFPPHQGQFANVSDVEREAFVSCGRAIIDKATGEVNGVLLIDINEKVIKDIISAEVGESGYVLILDVDNNVIISTIDMKGKLIGIENIQHSEGKSFTIDLQVNNGEKTSTQSVIATYQEIPVTGWKVMGIIPVKQLNQWGNILLLLTGFLTIVIVGLAVYTAVRTSNRVTKPITNLRLAMGQVEKGDMEVNITTDSHYEEVNELAGSFNIMVAKVKELMNRIYEEQRKLRKAELKVLQSQINPHFLYNTLDTIIWLIESGEIGEAVRMVSSLSNFFRFSLSRGQNVITIAEEAQHIRSYLEIQQMRYRDLMTYEIDIPEELAQYTLPKLTLQPLVENALYHGIKNRRRKGSIHVACAVRDGSLVLTVADDGAGMTAERLAEMRESLKDGKGEGFGLRAVHQRIQILFGNEYGLAVESAPDRGTQVFVTIPMQTADKEMAI